MNNQSKFVVFAGFGLLCFGSYIIMDDFSKRPPPDLTECQKFDGSGHFTFITGEVHAEFGLFGNTLFFDIPNKWGDKMVKEKAFAKKYECRPVAGNEDFIPNEIPEVAEEVAEESKPKKAFKALKLIRDVLQ